MTADPMQRCPIVTVKKMAMAAQYRTLDAAVTTADSLRTTMYECPSNTYLRLGQGRF